MAFVSKKEHNKMVNKINRGNGGRKLFTILTIVLNILLILFLIIGMVGYIYGDPVFELFVYNDTHEIAGLTDAGLASFILACIVLGFDLISIIVIMTMKSSRTIAKEVRKVASTPIGGKRKKSSVAATVRSRTTN